ncbi:MAG: Gfo/Idh/MocA family protein [Candidatus Zipacnadales bacterium]
MTHEVRFGIVGLGVGRDRANKVADTPGAKLVAVCDIHEERGARAAKELGVEWLRDYDELLAREDIDVVGIYTPSGMHCDFAVRALQAGKHTFTTKPMDLTVEKCDTAIAEAKRRGLILAVDFDSRYRAENHRIKAAVEAGVLGKIILGDLRMKWFRSQAYYDGGSPAGWRSRLTTERGSMANQGVHYVDLLQWWLGPVESVIGTYGTFAHNIESEDLAAGILQFASGAKGIIVTTTTAFPGQGTRLEIGGDRGTLAWQDQKLVVFQAVKGEAAVMGEWASPAAEELCLENFPAPDDLPPHIIADMVGAITEGKPVQCDGEEGRKSVAIFQAVYESSDREMPVSLR